MVDVGSEVVKAIIWMSVICGCCCVCSCVSAAISGDQNATNNDSGNNTQQNSGLSLKLGPMMFKQQIPDLIPKKKNVTKKRNQRSGRGGCASCHDN
jgi:hypothetical protein